MWQEQQNFCTAWQSRESDVRKEIKTVSLCAALVLALLLHILWPKLRFGENKTDHLKETCSIHLKGMAMCRAQGEQMSWINGQPLDKDNGLAAATIQIIEKIASKTQTNCVCQNTSGVGTMPHREGVSWENVVLKNPKQITLELAWETQVALSVCSLIEFHRCYFAWLQCGRQMMIPTAIPVPI